MTSPTEPHWPVRESLVVSPRRSGGFSLIELIVVLAVMSFVLALIVGYKVPWSRTLNLRGTAAELAADLRLARSQAIADNRPVAVAFDLAAHRYRVGSAAVRALAPQLSIGLITVDGERRSATLGDIRFNPDGSSTGGRVILADGTKRIAVGVDWLTGRVLIADVR